MLLALVATSAAMACGDAFSNSGAGGSAGTSGSSGSSGSSGNGGSKAHAGASGSSATGGASASGGSSGGGAGGATSGGSSGAGSGGRAGLPGDGSADAVAPCTQASQCPTPASRCRLPVCIGNRCGEAPLAPGLAPADVRGDCLKIMCAAGEEQIFADPTDSDDGRECTTDSCNGTTPSHTPRTNQSCSAGFCDSNGDCAGCTNDTQCAPGPTCKPNKCVSSKCVAQPAAAATFCNAFADQCDGNGNCVDCVDNGGCGECCVCLNHICIPA